MTEQLEDLVEPATRRLPALGEVPIESSWWGYYDMSPDGSALILLPVPAERAAEAESFAASVRYAASGTAALEDVVA